jgi:septal ring factor EnvC (AmiA/AmiB activator)
MSESKEDIAAAVREFFVAIKSSPNSSLVTYFGFQLTGQNNKYYSESLTNQLQVANQQVKQFNENISVTNIALSQLKEQFSDFKLMQSEIQNSIKDHEKRLIKIEVKEGIR